MGKADVAEQACTRQIPLMGSPCCDRMAFDLAQRCEQHPDPNSCPDAMIAPARGGYGLYVRDGEDGCANSIIEIAYCPCLRGEASING